MPNNKNEDTFYIFDETLVTKVAESKSRNVSWWDFIDSLVQESLEEIAQQVGIQIDDWGDLDLISETRDFITQKLGERFGIKFPFVDENY